MAFINWMKQQSRQENLTYLTLWGMLFVAPLISLYVRVAADEGQVFDWQEVMAVWRQYAVFLLIFLLHNFLIAPLLVYRQKRLLYCCTVVVVSGLFVLYQCTNRPVKLHRGPHPMELPRQWEDDDFPRHEHGQFEWEAPPDHRMHGDHPPVMLGEHDVVAFVILVLMLGMNVGIKLYFKTRGDEKKLVQLEKENLEQQLEYLKYQINPHFFMNTLNNIHALVDIDPEKAKGTILELSKMMRFVLYEGDKQGVPLTREFDFIRHYVTLMRLRYTERVKIDVDLPSAPPDKLIPPLMLITFIENAFKHGISYQHDSFVDISVGIEHERLRFTCRNSKAETTSQESGGVGLANVRKRLNLLYGNNFMLNIEDEADIYNVELNIPL